MSTHPERSVAIPQSEMRGLLNYIECPTYITNLGVLRRRLVFLAGGITNCPDWQSDMTDMLSKEDVTLLNPRRKNFPINDQSAAEKQIHWELYHLNWFDPSVLFWFTKESVAPIALHEFGKYLNRHSIFVGVHPEYPRKADIEIRIELERPSLDIAYTLEDLAQQVIDRFHPVDPNIPITDLKGWTWKTGELLKRWSSDGQLKTVGDWMNFLFSEKILRYAETGNEVVREVHRRLVSDMGISKPKLT